VRNEVLDMLKRHAIQVLRQAGHTLEEIGELVDVSQRSVQRVVGEPVITHHDTERADFGDADHAVRRKSITQFGGSRSPSSVEVDHRFRSKAITEFG
jgi:hypothetical protein